MTGSKCAGVVTEYKPPRDSQVLHLYQDRNTIFAVLNPFKNPVVATFPQNSPPSTPTHSPLFMNKESGHGSIYTSPEKYHSDDDTDDMQVNNSIGQQVTIQDAIVVIGQLLTSKL